MTEKWTAVVRFKWTYNVGTEGSEGMSPTHVEMRRVEPLEEVNVIKTLRLQDRKTEKRC